MKMYFALAASALALAASPASAAQYSFDFSTDQQLFGGPVTGSGIFTTSDMAMTVGGETAYAITSISGMVNGSQIVAPTSASYGNYFTTGPTFLDGSGVNFGTAAGTTVAFFNQSNNGLYRVNTFSPGSSSFVTATSSAVGAVPEPATWAMLLLGFGMVGFAMRRRRSVRPTVSEALGSSSSSRW